MVDMVDGAPGRQTTALGRLRRWRSLTPFRRPPLNPADHPFAVLFDAEWYRRSYPDVAASGADPLRHYLEHGAAEGRDPGPLFSTRWYLDSYPDVAQSGMNPLQHYWEAGAAEGRDPGPQFSTRGYLSANPDVAAQGINPLEHYIAFGAAEGRPLVSVVARQEAELRRPGREALRAAAELISTFAASEYDLAQLPIGALEELPTAAELPDAMASGWRGLYLSLDHVPRALVVVGSIDDKQLRRYLTCLGAAALASRDPAELLIVAADEACPSMGIDLPRGTAWRSLAEFRAGLSFHERVQILMALIHNLRPQSVLVLDSEIGWEVLARHGSSMQRYAGLFGGFPAADRMGAPPERDFALRYLRRCLPFLAAVYAEDREWLERTGERYGLPEAARGKFRLLPQTASDAVWVSVLSREPGFLSKKRAVLP